MSYSNKCTNPIPQVASMPYPLYLSLQGKYFVGDTDILEFGKDTNAWSALYNPKHSCVNLHVYVWTVTNLGEEPIIAEIWFNTDPPGSPTISNSFTPSNTALCPLPTPKVKILQAELVTSEPINGTKAFTRVIPPFTTVASDDDGKFIFPPGGNFTIFLKNDGVKNTKARVAYGWFEEPISY